MSIAFPKLVRSSHVSLRWVLAVPFVLLTFGATAIVGFLSYRNAQETAKNLGNQLVQQTNERVSQELKSYLKTPLFINRLNVDAVNRGQIDLQNTPALEAALFDRSQQFDQVTAILFVSDQGKLRVVERLPEGLYSVETDPPRPNKLRIYPLDNQGRRKQLIVSKHNLDVRDRPWYKRAVTDKTPGWSTIAQYGSCQALALTASQPVYDRATNGLLGVFAVHLRLDYLSQFLNGLDISRAGQVIITNQSGDLIATSTKEQPYTVEGTTPCPQFKQLRIDQSQNGLTRSLGEYLRDRSIDQPQFLEFKYNGNLHSVKVTPFRDANGLDWRIITVIPKSEFMGAIEQTTATTVLLSLLTLGAAIALGGVAAKKFSDQFEQFNQASQALAAGNLDRRLLAHSILELNTLSETFNQMADQLQDAFDRLKTNLAESEEKFAVIFHNSPDPITLVSTPEGLFVEANESFLNLLEYPREALIGQVLIELGVWVDLEQRTHFIEALHQHGFVRNLEVQLMTRTRQIKTVLMSAELIQINDDIYSLAILRDISDRKTIEDDRKQAQAALLESETRFRQLAETVQEGFFVYETETNHYSYVNSAYSRIKGESPQVIYEGLHQWLDHIYPDDLERIEAALERERQGENFDQEYRYIRPDGELRWLRSKAFPIQNEAGTVIRIVGTFEDITDVKQRQAEREATERALKQIQERYSLATRAAKVGVWEWNLQTNELYLDPNIKALIGYTDAEIRNEAGHWMTLVHPDDRAGIIAAAQAYLAGKTPEYVVEYRMLHQNGSIVWILLRGQSIRDEQSNPDRLIGTNTDITERKHIEEALRASEERFRRAFDDAPIGMALVSPTGQFLRANPCYCALVGYTEAELITLTFPAITHPADQDKDIEGFRQMLSGSIRSFCMEKRYVTKQGNSVPVTMSTAPIRDQAGQVLYFVGHIQDLRDRLKVDRMKDEFISVVSHELRTPLTSIRGSLGILESGVFQDRPEKAQQMMQIAVNNSDRLVRLVNDILTLERLESGKAPLVMESCQITDLMQQAVQSVQTLADQSGIVLSLTPTPGTVWAAPDAIVQTLTNLISNAIKFSTSGSTVWITAVSIDHSCKSEHRVNLLTPYSLFAVKDQGRGVPQDKLDIIFEQFQQVDVSDSRKKGGTGLGLAICKQIVQQHHGQIWVESNVGEGSTFYFALPSMLGKESS